MNDLHTEQEAAPQMEPPKQCDVCAGYICLRQQVISMALGYINKTLCLTCISVETGRSRKEVFDSVLPYIRNRACFLKSWNRYTTGDDCPEPDTCLEAICFQKE